MIEFLKYIKKKVIDEPVTIKKFLIFWISTIIVVNTYKIIHTIFTGGNNMQRSIIVEDINNLPMGTMVYLDITPIPVLIYADSVIVNDINSNYLSAMLPSGLIKNDFGTQFNTYNIKEVIYLGPDLDSLTQLDGDIPERFLPLGSIVNLLVEKNISINDEVGNIYTTSFMIVGYNPRGENKKIYDYLLIEVPQPSDNIHEIIYLNANHYELGKILHIPKELDISRCFREELVNLDVMTHEMPQESIDKVNNCANIS